MQRKKILLVTQNLDDMILDDSEILKKYFDVEILVIRNGKEMLSKLGELARKIKQADLCFVWFATSYAFFATFFAKLLGKPSAVVVGGYDVVYVPEINYGLPGSAIKKIFPKYALKWADAILPFSKDSEKEMFKNFNIEREKSRVVYLGVNPIALKKVQGKKQNAAVTVGVVKKENLKRKGLEVFVRAAKFLPETKFVLIGDTPEQGTLNYLKEIASENVQFKNLGYNTGKIVQELGKSKVYVQISYHEGFGRALAESLCQECVPVVSKRGAIPEVAGKAGFYVNNLEDAEEVAQKIALALKSGKGKAARKWASQYTLERREKALLEIINNLLSKYEGTK